MMKKINEFLFLLSEFKEDDGGFFKKKKNAFVFVIKKFK